MRRINNKELADALIDKHGLSKQDAEKFVAKLFEVIGNGLQSDKLVKVKGLGTFKVVSVASRKSVDVNTGEPIIIDGRDKINFVPDASMRDSVNRPFAQFETVVVNDGVDFSGIDKKYEDSEKEDIPDNSDNPEASEIPETSETVEELKDETVKEDFSETEKNNIEEKASTNTEEKPAIVEEVPTKEEPTDVDEEAEPAAINTETAESPDLSDAELDTKEKEIIEVDTEKEIKKDIDTGEEKETERKAEKETETNKETEVSKQYIAAQHRMLKAVCTIAAVVVILLGAGAFYLYDQLQLRDHRIENLEAQVLEKKHRKTTVKKPVRNAPTAIAKQDIVSADDSSKASDKQEDVQLKPNVAKEPALQKTEIESKETAKSKETANYNNKNVSNNNKKETDKNNKEADNYNYNKDVRIRTGAYHITGIDHTITVRSGQTLAGISRSQLGPGMECYVEAVNRGRTEFKAGEKVNIPKLKLKKRK